MGGEGPYIRFTPSSSLRCLSAQDCRSIEDVYNRAHDLLLLWKQDLVRDHGYSETPLPEHPCKLVLPPEEALFTLYFRPKYSTYGRYAALQMPRSAFSFNTQDWENLFMHYLRAKRTNRDSSTLSVDEPPPVQNMIYLLQTIFDGLIALVRMDEIDDLGEATTARVLPAKEWIEQNAASLQQVLGIESIDPLLSLPGFCYTTERSLYTGYGNDYRDDDMDFTACSRDCGYCGACDY